ncbi:putative bifunctional diguanylate cyclase/phosphodiesterase [Aureimonas pseudogalii]|uniref:Diguanylate cyclase (GGDEF)-like protein n=1 Tax=Aureimonas pseudogalii TaxID=1744844 RepID=A0A7W6H4L9_9HYPH|nr:EAL domain-containing protein [Aureimonas pseudogalii]MBB3997279.1 diguanylate cyclase (GGDEF)-like protein [Aureimonas pseudogalii]
MPLHRLSIRARVEPSLADAVLDALAHPVLTFDDRGEVTLANASAQVYLGGWIVGLTFADLFPGHEPFDRFAASGKEMSLTSKTHARFRGFMGAVGAGARVLSLFPDEAEAPVVVLDEDELTGLLKRNGLHSRLEGAVAATVEGGGRVAVHCIDLDRFKLVNDTLGHGIGDLLLKKVSDRIRSACRKGDGIARIGGDEFVVVQTGVVDPQDAERLATRLVELIGRTYVLSGHTVNIGASVGVAVAEPKNGPRDLLRNADLALYEAKRAGRGRFRVFETGMDAALRDRRELEIDLRRASALKQFDVHYQPFVDLYTNRVIGFEALIRWDHPVRGRVSPVDFIPLAEETGLICKIGEWVLRTACATAMTWPEEMTVAVNISPVQFRSDALVQTVLSALAHSGLPAHRLEIEITEGALLENTANVLATLHALRDLGIKISMDDFGTGYSSLSYLQKFPFNKIKIDRSFVQGADEGGDSEAILKAIAGLGLSLGMAITAEGVETQEQLARIRSEQCTHVQGYFTGRPMSADSISTFLSA